MKTSGVQIDKYSYIYAIVRLFTPYQIHFRSASNDTVTLRFSNSKNPERRKNRMKNLLYDQEEENIEKVLKTLRSKLSKLVKFIEDEALDELK